MMVGEPPECENLLRGTVAAGGTCVGTHDCADADYRCQTVEEGSCGSICQPFVEEPDAVGEPLGAEDAGIIGLVSLWRS